MSSDQGYDHWDAAYDLGIQRGRRDAAKAITDACQHTIPHLVCTSCVRAAAVAIGLHATPTQDVAGH